MLTKEDLVELTYGLKSTIHYTEGNIVVSLASSVPDSSVTYSITLMVVDSSTQKAYTTKVDATIDYDVLMLELESLIGIAKKYLNNQVEGTTCLVATHGIYRPVFEAPYTGPLTSLIDSYALAGVPSSKILYKSIKHILSYPTEFAYEVVPIICGNYSVGYLKYYRATGQIVCIVILKTEWFRPSIQEGIKRYEGMKLQWIQ